MTRSAILAAILAAGCSDYGFSNDYPVWPSPAPMPLPAVTQTDAIVQVTTPQVDVLWMVDNSCSMSNEQADLTENFPFFMEFFEGSGLDFHVGVTSSDIISTSYDGSDGTLVTWGAGNKYIDPDTPNPVQTFTEMASLGTTGRFPEKGLGATYKCLELKRDTANAGFYRDDAAIHTIIISDEPDYTESSLITQPEFVEWYEGLKEDVEMRTFSGIIDRSDCCRYEDSIQSIGGILWDLRDENWPGVLERLGLQAAGMKTEYFLSHLPVAGTIEVEVETPEGTLLEFQEGEEWVYDASRNSVEFVEFIPAALSTVLIHYQLLASAHEEIEEF